MTANLLAGTWRVTLLTAFCLRTFGQGNPSNIKKPDSAAAKAKTLTTATVSAKKAAFEIKPDRTVIHVDSNIAFTGSSVLDILEITPGVSVNRQSNSVDLQGKSGVKLMVNGKILIISMEAAIQMMAGMNSGSIEKIELITTPPANYDAEGNAGFINIVLKKDSRFGTNGSLSASLGYSAGYLGSVSLDFNHRQGKVNLYGNFSGSNVNSLQEGAFSHSSSYNESIDVSSSFTHRHYDIGNCTGLVGLDYQAGAKTIIGAQVSGASVANLVGIRSWNTGYYLSDGKMDSTLTLFDHEAHNTYNIGANLNLEHIFNPSQKFTANLDYLHWLDDNPISYLDSAYGPGGDFVYDKVFSSHKRTLIDTWVLTLDYDHRISKAVDLQAGIKGTLTRFTNQVEIDSLSGKTWTREPSLSGTSYLRENYPAAYVSLNADLDDKTNITAGLRFEFTNTRLGTDSVQTLIQRHYGDIFPTLTFTRKLGTTSAIDLSYSRRINRPTINNLAPFVIFFDPYTYVGGNPALLPGITDNLGLQYHYKKYVLALSYSNERNSIADFFPSIDSISHIETLSAVNLRYLKTAMALLTIPIRVSNRYNMSFAVTANWQQFATKYNGTNLELGGQWFTLQGTQEFRLPKDFTLEIIGNYQSGGYKYAFKISPLGSLNFAVRKALGTGGTLTFNANDILNTMAASFYIDQPGQNLVTSGRLKSVYPSYKITWSRNFGNGAIKAKRERSTGAEDERKRVQ
jgi:hypothetical protein